MVRSAESVQHRAGKQHTNADALSRLETDKPCKEMSIFVKPENLPCGGCKHCNRVHEKWKDFAKIDDIIPLAAVRVAKINKMVNFLDKRSSEWLYGKDMNVGCSEEQDFACSDTRGIITESTDSKVGLNVTKVEDSNNYGLSYTTDQLSNAQENDSDLSLIRSYLPTKIEPEDNILFLAGPAAKKYIIKKEQFFMDEGLRIVRLD